LISLSGRSPRLQERLRPHPRNSLSPRHEELAVVTDKPGRSTWRELLGAFQITITINTKAQLLHPEERLLARLRWIQQAISIEIIGTLTSRDTSRRSQAAFRSSVAIQARSSRRQRAMWPATNQSLGILAILLILGSLKGTGWSSLGRWPALSMTASAIFKDSIFARSMGTRRPSKGASKKSSY
jgi:hypothetical protein